MATQNVDFSQTGPTLDTGEKDAPSIRPVLDGEPAIQATFQRPSENLRTRTEVLRNEVEGLKYIVDADRALVLEGGGDILWGGATDAGGTGVFTMTAALTLRPFMTPGTSTPAKATIRGVLFRTLTTGAVVPRAYSGANKISVRLTGSNGAVLNATVTGTPADNIAITLNTNAVAGTTKQDLITYINTSSAPGPTAIRALGVEAALSSGAGTDIICPDGVFVATDAQTLSGAVDAEKHVLGPTAINNFFLDAANKLQNNDVLAIAYEEGLVGASYGGRRQSLTDAPETSSDVSDNIFVLRRFPERVPYALPLATVINGNLRFVDSTVLAPSVSGSIGSSIGLPPPTSEPPAQFLRMSPVGDHYWGPITQDMIVPNMSIQTFGISSSTPSISGGLVEVGTSITALTFSAAYQNGPPISASLIKNADVPGAVTQVITPPTSGSISATISPADAFVKTTTGSAIFRLSAVGSTSPTPVTKDVVITWARRFYFGFSVSASPSITEAFVEALASSTLSASRGVSGVLSAPGTASYAVIAYPTALGALVGWRDNTAAFDIDFDLLSSIVNVTPIVSGATAATYFVYRSRFPLSGGLNFTTR